MKWIRAQLLVLCLLATGSAQTLGNGTEVLLTDLESQRIVGHGKVEAGKLILELVAQPGGFFLYIVSPDGAVATHNGEVEADGDPAVFTDDGQLVDLTAVLASRGVALELNPTSAPAVNPEAPSDDAVLRSPGD